MFKELASEEGQLSKNKTLLHTQMRNSSFKANRKKTKEKNAFFGGYTNSSTTAVPKNATFLLSMPHIHLCKRLVASLRFDGGSRRCIYKSSIREGSKNTLLKTRIAECTSITYRH